MRIVQRVTLTANIWNFILTILLVGIAVAPLQAQFTYVDQYEFDCSTGGCSPEDFGQLTQGSDGNLYGTTVNGGLHAFGTISMLTTTGTYSDVWDFDGVTGEQPHAGLTLASDGNFYGTTANGGTNNMGTLYRFSILSGISVLHSFTSSEATAQSSPVQGKDGNLYGATSAGTIYSVSLAGTYKQLSQAPGAVLGPFLLASDGNLYGGSQTGGTFDNGTMFRVTTPSGAVKVIHNFNGSDGSNPCGAVVQLSDGNLYGTTASGGLNNAGEIFKMNLNGKITVLHAFDPNGSSDGGFPEAGLLGASDGFLYGVNTEGGSNFGGTIFRVNTIGSFTKLFDFTFISGPVPGAYSDSALIQHTNGNFYGVASSGGASDGGVFFSLLAPNLTQILKVAGPIFLLPGGPVQILGNNLTHVIAVNFGGVFAQFTLGTYSVLTATVPNGALDGLVNVIYDTGLMTQTLSYYHILPKITNLDPSSGHVGSEVNITGGGFTGAKKVTFGGVAAASFSVLSATLIQATVPTGAKTGKVGVQTPNGSATSPVKFTVN